MILMCSLVAFDDDDDDGDTSLSLSLSLSLSISSLAPSTNAHRGSSSSDSESLSTPMIPPRPSTSIRPDASSLPSPYDLSLPSPPHFCYYSSSPPGKIFSTLAQSHSLLHKGHTDRVLCHF